MAAELPAEEQPRVDEAGALLPAATSGDRRALDTLARWCLPRVRRTVVLSYGNGPERDDLVQTAMAKVFSRLGSFRGEASFYVWVDRLTINVVRDHFRRRSFPLAWFGEEDAARRGHHSADNPAELAEQHRVLRRLAEHFGAIKPSRRLPLVLKLAHGYSVPEVAAILGISFEAAKKRLARGRRELLALIKQDPYCREVLGELKR